MEGVRRREGGSGLAGGTSAGYREEVRRGWRGSAPGSWSSPRAQRRSAGVMGERRGGGRENVAVLRTGVGVGVQVSDARVD